MNAQQAKESAVLLAIKQGFGLVRRNLEVHAVDAMGSMKLISRSTTGSTVWHDALAKLRKVGDKTPQQVSQMRVDPYELAVEWNASSRGETEGFVVKS